MYNVYGDFPRRTMTCDDAIFLLVSPSVHFGVHWVVECAGGNTTSAFKVQYSTVQYTGTIVHKAWTGRDGKAVTMDE